MSTIGSNYLFMCTMQKQETILYSKLKAK